MTEEEKENFLKRLGYIEQGYLQNGHITVGNCNDIKKAINLIQKQDTEINKLNSVIDRMAEVLNDFDYDKQCESCRTDICSASVDGTEYTQCIKEYFMKPEQN